MLNFIPPLIDSIETSVTLKIFPNKKKACMAHIYKSELVKINMNIFENINNFNSNRLQSTAIKAYPLNDRPRGMSDIKSVKYHQKQIKENKQLLPIWMIYKNNQYTLLDGAHRIVASYIENIPYIYCNLIVL
jgi:hypothetical protein